jgi:hypothetical protein
LRVSTLYYTEYIHVKTLVYIEKRSLLGSLLVWIASNSSGVSESACVNRLVLRTLFVVVAVQVAGMNEGGVDDY